MQWLPPSGDGSYEKFANLNLFDTSLLLNHPTPPTQPLIIDDEDRYSRLRLIGWWDQSKIAAAKILVVGAGALGNEVLKNLALLGLGKIYLIDLDEVQESNLSRSVLFRHEHTGQSKALVAAKMIGELNPDCVVVPIHGNVMSKIGLGLVRECNLVIGCLDNREARLWVNRMCWKTSTPWIDGGIQEINGVAKVFVPPDGACYECAMTENDYRLISLRYSCPLLKREDVQMGKVPTAPTIASIVGGLQVQEALKLLHDLPSAEGTALVFNGVVNNFYQTKYTRREDCLSHETYEPIQESSLGNDATVGELLDAVAAANGVPPESLSLQLDRDFLLRLDCRSCSLETEINQPLCEVGSSRGLCTKCGQALAPVLTSEIETESPLLNRTLAELGIPDYDIVSVDSEESAFFVLLKNREGI